MELIIIILLSISFSVLIAYAVTIRLHKCYSKNNKVVFETYPMVSILKPVSGFVDDMESSIESFFKLEYINYEIVFGVEDINSPYLGLINKLRVKYPYIKTKLVEVGFAVAQNPKINTLSLIEKHCSGLLYWIADSNIKVKKDVLKLLVNEYIINGSKVVFSPIRGTDSRTIGSIIENAYLNFMVSGSMIFAWSVLRQQVITGKSILIEKKTLDIFGGFKYFINYLAEDFMMGEAFTNGKFKISTNYVWVDSVNNTSTISKYFKRMERWAKLRFNLKKHLYFLEILFNPIMISLIAAIIFGGIFLKIFVFALLLKIGLEYSVFITLNNDEGKNIINYILFPFCICIKDIILFVVYFIPFFSSTVKWCDKKVSIGKYTLIDYSIDNLFYEGA